MVLYDIFSINYDLYLVKMFVVIELGLVNNYVEVSRLYNEVYLLWYIVNDIIVQLIMMSNELVG